MAFRVVLKACAIMGVCFYSFQAKAQTTTTSSGNWTDITVWSTGVVPVGATTVNVINPLILDQNIAVTTGTYSFFQNVTDLPGGTAYTLTVITAGGTLDIKAGTTTFEGAAAFDNSSIFVRNGATLIVGPLTLDNNTAITVESGGTLIINGDFTNNNNGTGTFTISGLVQVNGNYNAPVGSVDLAGAGNFFATGTISTTGSSAVFGSTNNCTTGPCSGNNLCSFSNTITANQTLCSGSTPALLNGNAVAAPVYSWESSTSSTTSGFALASGTNNTQTYTSGALATTTWYRRKVTSGGCTGISVPLQMTIVPSAGGWVGTTNNWNTNTNWCNNTVPTSTTDVSISTGVANMPQITAASNCRDLTINSGASVTLNASNTLNIYGNLTNNGTFTLNTSTVTLSGSTQQTLSGLSPVTFNNLTVASSSGSSPQILFSTFIAVNNALTMTSGNINLSGFNLTVGTAAATPGSLSYTAGRMYGGYMTRWFNTPTIALGNVAGLFPIGTSTDYRPFYVGYTSVLTSGGTIRAGHTGVSTTSTVSFADGASTILRRSDSFWNVDAGNGLNVGATPFQIRAEGTGFGTVALVTDLRLVLSGSVTGIGTSAVSGGTTANPQVNRTAVPLTGITNNFYVGSTDAINSPLPVTLTDFSGLQISSGTKLNWTTESELNFDYFQLEKSREGEIFTPITLQKGKGTLSSRSDYSYLDNNTTGKNYYRLKIVDIDRSFVYSRIIVVDAGDAADQLTIYPNPITTKKFTVAFSDADPSTVQVILMDQLGRTHSSMEFDGIKGEFQLSESVPPGVYFIKIYKGASQRTIKVIVL